MKEDQPDRQRLPKYLKYIREKPCLCCGAGSDAHHLTFAQPKALASKVGDQFCVPLCRACHSDLHTGGLPERTWWAVRGILPLVWAERTYLQWLKDNKDGY
jgi:hypothetical protein